MLWKLNYFIKQLNISFSMNVLLFLQGNEIDFKHLYILSSKLIRVDLIIKISA